MDNRRFEWLDLCRGLAAMGVAIYHYQKFLGARHANYAFVAVDLFFALSGLVLTLRYREAIRAGMTPVEFVGVRLRRLYPMVAITGLFIAALNLARVPSGVAMGADDRHAWTVLLVTPLPGTPAGPAWPADSPIWSLWAELVANAAWFLAVKAGRRMEVALGAIAMAATLGVTLQMDTLNFGWESGMIFRIASLMRALAWFAVGSAIALRAARLRDALVVAATCAACWLAASCALHGPAGINELLAAATSVALLNAAYRLPAPHGAVCVVARWMGRVSFPLYLLHAPAGRFLGGLAGLPHGLAFVLAIGGTAIAGMVANEAAVRLVALAHRGLAARATAQAI